MRFYRALLHLYPKSFRAEYGSELLAVIAERRAVAGGIGGCIALAAGATADTIANAARVHADVLGQDVRYSARSLRRAPAFTLTAILLAAVGIGATTAAVAIADHVLLRPLPYPEPDRLVRFWGEDKGSGGGFNVLSPSNYRDLIAETTALKLVAAYTPQFANLIGAGTPVRLEGQRGTGALLEVLGTPPAMGRIFSDADGLDTSPPVVVLSHRAWATHFAGDVSIIGRSIVLNGTAHEVVGVMPSGFMFPDRDTEFWAPLTLDPGAYADRTNTFLWTIARLAEGRTIEQADAELEAVAAELERQFPKENERLGVLTVDLRGNLTRANRTMIAAVVGAAACLLLIAGTNLAGLLLSRALSRQREMAVRAAIGAGRERLARQMLTESFLVAGAGGAVGAVLAIVSTPLLARLVPTTLPITDTPTADLRFVALAAGLALVTAIVFGLVPARRAAGANLDALKQSARTGSSKRSESARGALVIAQIAASVVLLVSVGLLGQALLRVQGRSPGFEAADVITMRTSLPWPKYGPAPQRSAFYDRVLGEIRALPGVANAAYITGLPMVVSALIWEVTAEGGAPLDSRQKTVGLRFVTPGYFDTMRIPIQEGRDISASDTRDATFVAVVSESFAKRHWPGQSAIGRRFNVAFNDRLIVGVAGDVRVRGLERESEPQVYMAAPQMRDFSLINSPPKDLVVRSAGSPTALVPALRDIMTRADPEQPISNVRLLEDVVADQTASRAAQVRVLVGFAAAAVLLAGIGLYGLLAFSVSQRTREIGLRMALGATPASMVGLVVKRGIALAAIGAVVGAAAAYGAGRWMESILAGVSPHDVAVFGAAIALTALLVIAGTLLPAMRASRVDPLTATRNE
ncbi:MAG: ABC transporter permease [Acidobacteriota bacterium]|nr:ABC transporter permease [Acidobacteriota bacterium]